MIRKAVDVDGRKRRGRMTREIGYQKVVLAVHILADAEGLSCQECNATIARECGVSTRIARRSLSEMRRRGLIEIFDNRDGLSIRKIVLLDHPGAGALVEQIRRSYGNRIRIRGHWLEERTMDEGL